MKIDQHTKILSTIGSGAYALRGCKAPSSVIAIHGLIKNSMYRIVNSSCLLSLLSCSVCSRRGSAMTQMYKTMYKKASFDDGDQSWNWRIQQQYTALRLKGDP